MKCHCSIVTDMDTLVLWIAFLMCPQITYLSLKAHDLWVMPVFSLMCILATVVTQCHLWVARLGYHHQGERGVKGCSGSLWVGGGVFGLPSLMSRLHGEPLSKHL